jgi:predicted transposase YdaD
MARASDIGSKRLIGLAPDQWVRWVTGRPDAVADEILTAEFQWVSRESDVLIRAHAPEVGHFLVLCEMQTRYDPQMPTRMNAYAALAQERYRLPVYPVLVNILPPPAGVQIADRFESALLGLQVWRDYRVLNLWEVDARVVLQQPLPTLLPFVPVLKGGDDESIIRQALRALRADARLSELEPLLAFFASFVLDTRLVQQIMRWDMVVLEQSPWYQEIVQTVTSRDIQRILEHRFGPLPEDVKARLQGKSLEELDSLFDAALGAGSLAAFVARLGDGPA